MKISDVVSFSKENFFNGAVQTEWFYDQNKVKLIAESYVFHGPKYYGVANNDVELGSHKLIDTASFTYNLTNKLYSQKTENNFLMTIAGYGTGKSHLAVCLGALFSNEGEIRKNIIENISLADQNIGEKIKDRVQGKNLVIILNGMNNFNLDAEVLRCVRLALKQNGISDDMLKQLTKSYDIAKNFVERTFDLWQNVFENIALKNSCKLKGDILKNYLISKLESDSNALSIVNSVYNEVFKDNISWDRGLSAGDVLLTVEKELCGDGKPFNKILFLFDEFGRYIEYTASNPAIAGDASLQQIFEAIQNANGNIIFVGFIQNELKAYLSRIEKTSNITRYIDRYSTASENLFLSSNFETILANILKKDEPLYSNTIDSIIDFNANYHKTIKSVLSRWDRSAIKKSVWEDDKLYRNVILKGCYPLHPITVWLLSSSHKWMQQRSTLAFASEMFEHVSNRTISNSRMNYIYPIQIVDSGIYNEMLNSEEKGLVNSQYCMLYRDIISKIGDKLSSLELTVLKAILITNIGRMSFYDRTDAIAALSFCSALSNDDVAETLKLLEDIHGVVAFDDKTNTFDFLAESNGFNEFMSVYHRYKLGIEAKINDLDDDILQQLSLTLPVETSFGIENHIASTEWRFSRYLMDISEISETLLKNMIKKSTDKCEGEDPRGSLIYLYCTNETRSQIDRVVSLYKTLNLDSYPIIFLLIDDPDSEILGTIKAKKALLKFSNVDRERFQKHIENQKRKFNAKITRKFTECVTQRLQINSKGLHKYSSKIVQLCSEKFSVIYTKPIYFPFDGFENKIKTQASSSLITLCYNLYNKSLTNIQIYNALSTKDKNRASSVLSVQKQYSWKVFDANCQLVEPQNNNIKEIISEVVDKLQDGEKHSVVQLFSKYIVAPYGMNFNSLSLLISYFMAYFSNQYNYYYGNEKLTYKNWRNNKGKTVIPDLNRIIIKKNCNIDVDIVGELCHSILNNIYVENCENFKSQLTDLIIMEGDSENNKYKIAQANTYLDHGMRLYKKIYEKLNQAKTCVSESHKTLNISRFIKIFDLIPDVEGYIESGLPYEYSKEYKEEINKIRCSIDTILKQKYLDVIKREQYNITQLSQMKLFYNNVSVILRRNGYDDLANETKNHIEKVQIELLAKQRYESSIIECERDIALSNTITNYKECSDLIEKLKGWVSFIKGASDLPDSFSTSIIVKIKNSIYSLENKQNLILADYNDTIEKCLEAEDIIELKKIQNKVKNLMTMDLDLEMQEKLLLLVSSIDSVVSYVDNLPKNIGELIVIEEIVKTDKQYNWCPVVQNSIRNLMETLKKQQSAWIEKYIHQIENNIEKMSLENCLTWLDRTNQIPEYFETNVIYKVANIRNLVEEQLHKNRIDSLLLMYDRLTDEEKNKFKILLESR